MPESEENSLSITIPGRWSLARLSHAEAIHELDRCASILSKGAAALQGLYLRICDMIREHELTDVEIRQVLSKHFPPPRVSEFLLVARAPNETYLRYRAGFIGFRAVLERCRYRVHTDEFLKRRKIRRAAERLISLLGHGELTVSGHRVIVV